MAIIVHPLTAVGGVPAYTADDYRHAVNPWTVPSNGLPFDGLQGVRAGFQQPLATLDGLTVTVQPHCGVVCPFGGNGVYTYAITIPESVKIPDSNSNYKIAVVVDDPTQTQGDTPGGLIKAFPSATPDSKIPGLVIASVSQSVISIVAPVLYPTMLVEVPDVEALEALHVADGQEALVKSTGHRYVMEAGSWHDTVEVVTLNWLGGTVSFIYGATSCTIQVVGVKLSGNSWDSAVFKDKVKPACRPVVKLSAPLMVENGQSNTGLLTVDRDGSVSVRNQGGSGSDSRREGCVSWPISTRY